MCVTEKTSVLQVLWLENPMQQINFPSFKVWTWIEEMLRGSKAGPVAPQPTEDE